MLRISGFVAVILLLIVSMFPASDRFSDESNSGSTSSYGTRDDPVLGNSTYFWMSSGSGYDKRLAYLVAFSDHLLLYLESGLNYTEEQLVYLVDTFENVTYPRLTEAFGHEPRPPDDVDGDPRVTVFINDGRSYFSSLNELTADEYEYSNEREMFYVGFEIDPRYVARVMAHEFCHLISWNGDPSEVNWVEEGLAMYAESVAGFGLRLTGSFETYPSVSLTEWIEDLRAGYGASGLFFKYLSQNYGGSETILNVVSNPLEGIDGISSTLAARGYSSDFQSVFDNWTIANYLNNESVAGTTYWYQNVPYFRLATPTIPTIEDYPYSSPQPENLTRWATHYYILSGQWKTHGNLEVKIRELDGEGLHISVILIGSEITVEHLSFSSQGTARFVLPNSSVDVIDVVLVISSQPSTESYRTQYSLSASIQSADEADSSIEMYFLVSVLSLLLVAAVLALLHVRRMRTA